MALQAQESATKSSTSSTTTTSCLVDTTFTGLANLIKLLPTGTVFVFQFLNPLLTNNGSCHTANKYLDGALLILCGFSCAFSSFTDSYTGSDGKVYYGVATKDGLWSFMDPNASKEDLSKYKLRLGDFAHSVLSLIVFALIVLMDTNTAKCFYVSFQMDQKKLIMALPVVIGGFSSFVFAVFPNTRHGIGYRETQTNDSK